MNRLTAKSVSTEFDDGVEYLAVELLIDGESLMEMLRNFEAPMAKREGHPKLAAAYSWPALNSKTLAALVAGSEGEEGKVSVLECACGVPGCWPLRANIAVGPTEVVWSVFEQPHRSEESAAGHWSYEDFGPFTFSKDDYEHALRSIA